MPERGQCTECGGLLPAYWPKGLCAQCVLDGALGMTHAESQVQQVETQSLRHPAVNAQGLSLGSFGEYDLLEEIARGGMGVVYKARQRNLDRIVAVKMILAGSLAGKEFVGRFRTEAAAAAILQHPNIVAIHDVGVHEGRHYFSMDYVQGQNLAEIVGRQPLPPGKAARYVAIIAEAIHYAHERGILHRDLKPSNVLIDSETDQPRVTDFGLAKRLNGESSLTVSGQVLGSPSFMPPEQAGGTRGKLSRASDVYALGGILYYLLTARAPFQADSLEHVLNQVLHGEPVAPRLLDPSIPRDLEIVALKCLEKEPARRYQSARELAEELNRYLNHEPIHARPLSAPGRIWRWCRRKPVLASLIVLLHLVGAAGLTGILWQWQRAERHAASERQERRLGERQLYIANLNLVQHEWEQNHVSRARELLQETAGFPDRGFEWFYWQRQLHLELKQLRGHTGPVLAVGYLPDDRIVTASADGTAKIWEAETGHPLFALKGHSAPIRALAISADGRQILTGGWDRTVRLWDAVNGAFLRAFFGHRGAILSVAFSPDRQRMVTASEDDTARVWEIDSGRTVITFTGHSNRVWAVAFSPDGLRVVSSGSDGTARMWEAATGRELLTFPGHRSAIFSVTFSPDGNRVITGHQDHSVKVWDAASGRLLLDCRGHSGAVWSVGCSKDGAHIITGSEDQTARLWDYGTGNQLTEIKGHGSRIGSVALSPDGKRIVTGGGALLVSPGSVFIGFDTGGEPIAKVWGAAGSREVLTVTNHSADVLSLDVSPDGRSVASGSLDGTVRVWDLLTGDELHRLGPHTNRVRGAFTPDGRRMVIVSFDGSAGVWDIANRKVLYELGGHRSEVFSHAVSPDGLWIATGSWDKTVTVWEAATGRAALVFRGHSAQVFPVAFSPDSKRIVSADGSGVGKVWEVTTGRELATFQDSAKIWAVAFCPDGRRLVTGNHGRTAAVWDAATGRELVRLRGHTAHIHAAIFSPDGRRIVTGSADHTAKVWDAATGKEVLTLKGHTGWVFAVAFCKDGQRIITASLDDTIKVWHAASAEQVEGWRTQEQTVPTQEESTTSLKQTAGTPNLPGGITKWLVLSPLRYDGNNGLDVLDREQVPRESRLHPREGDSCTTSRGDLVWRRIEQGDYLLDFNQISGRESEYQVAYAVCYLESETSQSNLVLRVGSDDQSKVFLNEQEVYRTTIAESWIPDRDTVSGIELNPGLNVLVFKVVNERGEWKGSIRITDAAEEPVNGLRVILTPP